MAILSTIKDFMLYLKESTGYVLYRLSAQCVAMDNGNDLQTEVDTINNHLLDVESGTWTPVAYQNIKIGTVSYAKYYKVGRLVFISCYMQIASLNGGGKNIIRGLPYTPACEATIPINYMNIVMSESVWTNCNMMVNTTGDIYPAYWASGRSWNGDQCWKQTSYGYVGFSGCYLAKE